MAGSAEKVKLRPWTPFEIEVFFRNREDRALAKDKYAMLVRMATDDRMKGFWKWLDMANNEQGEGPELDPMHLFWTAVRGVDVPDPPGGISPKGREKHLGKVKHHAQALIGLLKGTRFDLDLEDISEGLQWDRKEVEAALLDYPNCTLTEQLGELVDWCQQGDCHDRHRKPTWMLRQSGSSARKHILSEGFYREFRHARLTPPWELFATLVNVVLDLPEDEEVHPDAMQKMIDRIVDRQPPDGLDSLEGRVYTLSEGAIEFYLEHRDLFRQNKK